MNLNPSKSEDPVVAWALWTLAAVTVIALVVVSVADVDDRAGARNAIVTGAGGVLLLLGSYFAARTLRQARADQRANRALKSLELMGSDKEEIRKAGRAVLDSLTTAQRGHPHTEVQDMIDAAARAVDIP